MVANLHLLPPRGFNLWVVPFKIDRATGAPTRVLARLNAQGGSKSGDSSNNNAVSREGL